VDKAEALDKLDEAQANLFDIHAWLEMQKPPPPITNFTIYGQQWHPWRYDRLGYSSHLTIGSWGCVVASAATIVSHATGTELTPRDVNQRMKDVGGFLKGTGLFIFHKLAEAYPILSYDGLYVSRYRPAPIERIDDHLAEGGYVIAQVDFNPLRADVQSHYLVLAGSNGNQGYWAVDPWIGGVTTIPPAYAEKGDWDAARTIYRTVFYS